MKVEIWSDVFCPFCYIGKRKFEQALAQFPHRDEVEVVWHSFQLQPDAPLESEGDVHEMLAKKYGMTRQRAQEMNAHVTNEAAKVGADPAPRLTRPSPIPARAPARAHPATSPRPTAPPIPRAARAPSR